MNYKYTIVIYESFIYFYSYFYLSSIIIFIYIINKYKNFVIVLEFQRVNIEKYNIQLLYIYKYSFIKLFQLLYYIFLNYYMNYILNH